MFYKDNLELYSSREAHVYKNILTGTIHALYLCAFLSFSTRVEEIHVNKGFTLLEKISY